VGVPADAWWSADDKEWVAGPRDAAGRLHGLVRYWRMDGTLVSECEHTAGVPSGVARRFHENGEIAQTAKYVAGVLHGTRTLHATDGRSSERFHTGRISRKVLRAEIDYEQGTAISYRYFDREGRPVASDGAPLPERPPGVPATAHRDANGDWIDGRWTETGKLIGDIRRWSAAGVLEVEEHHGDTEIRCTGFHDDGSRRLAFTLRDGAIHGDAMAWRRDGSVLRRATKTDARYAIEDFDRIGILVRRAEYDLAIAPAATVVPETDAPILTALARGNSGVVEGAVKLSPIGMARAIALGWGGDDDRDPTISRLARRIVRRLAPPTLAHRLDLLGFDRAPRILDAARAQRVVSELSEDPAVDAKALVDALVDAGATGIDLAVDRPARVASVIRARIRDRHLDISHLGLERLPSALARFPDLVSIDASANRLREVPVALADVFRLHKLDLGRNAIRTIPSELAWLPDLRTLHIADNELTAIPSGVFQLRELTALGLGDNALREVPDAIGDLVELRTLMLSDNPLAELPKGLTRLPKLVSLHLGNHPWTEPPAMIGEMSSLEELWLASPKLERLPAAICKLPKLRRLHLWYSALRDLPPEIYECKTLVELRIRENPLPDGTLERLKEALPGCTIY
jgi:hypothetical protein